MITDDAMEVHFCLRLLTGLQAMLNYPGVNQALGTVAPAVLVR